MSGNRTAIACVAIEVHDHYTTAPAIMQLHQRLVELASALSYIFQFFIDDEGKTKTKINFLEYHWPLEPETWM